MSKRPPIAAILALGVTQIIGYGTLYYSFSILAPDMAADLGWPSEWIFGVLSAALLIGGLTAPWMGALLDRIGAGRVMTIGSALAAAALTGCAMAPGKAAFIAALIAIETAANLVQYGAAFALLVQIRPEAAQRSITYLTLIAGFASTIFWPITTALHAELSWQNVYLVFAALNLFVCLPLHAWLARGVGKDRQAVSSTALPPPINGVLAPAARPLGLLLMITGFSLQSLVSSAVLVHMVPLLSGLGLGALASLVGTLFGPSQVLSRLTNMLLGRNLPPTILAMIAAALMPGGVVILILTAPSISGAMAFAVVFGLGNGLLSIVTGTLPLMLFGSEGYGKLQGKMMAARLIISATAPFVLALAMAGIGVTSSLAITAGTGGVAVVIFVVIGRLVQSDIHRS
ncbi:arsenite efflux MFS transporter ArsK [Sinorhizobium numidicum]|uniref:Arsenite efflux MFS transporter ArsK n=1 Tax=Sinorhizobium numidicum TaxID=680248 RepID=A0ABY8CZN6_9HYPH|nr:arsenite efflux MFS transporter ArsK [Sinorhizobium numidicum]WEX76164.1 arsenite efflux MFS transporter ArsK [Sinorhizobium numidicum]WEX82823.1 arsenite efflux MFS transporter ArsK [Sinorhizobium numidicum]